MERFLASQISRRVSDIQKHFAAVWMTTTRDEDEDTDTVPEMMSRLQTYYALHMHEMRHILRSVTSYMPHAGLPKRKLDAAQRSIDAFAWLADGYYVESLPYNMRKDMVIRGRSGLLDRKDTAAQSAEILNDGD